MSAISFTIEDLTIPHSIDDAGAEPFIEMVAVRNEIEKGILGTTALSVTPAGILPYFGDTPQRLRRHSVIRVDGRIAGRALLTLPMVAGATEARLHVEVLPEHRGQGIGTALLERLEADASTYGRTALQADPPHTSRPGGDRIPSPTGFGDVPADDPGARFLVRHGYDLELVARISSLPLGIGVEAVREHLEGAMEHAGPDYRVVTWTGATPEDRLDDLAALKSGMSTDAPMAGLEVVPDPWDADRVREHGLRQQATGRILLTAAAEHVPTGRLVAYTEIEVDRGDEPAAVQEDTLVLRAHRGHRLGMLVKAANIVRLVELAPSTTVVTTFNAEDNRPMLDVNEALGFEPIGLEGNWQKRL